VRAPIRARLDLLDARPLGQGEQGQEQDEDTGAGAQDVT
jgi:hypothetical protein